MQRVFLYGEIFRELGWGEIMFDNNPVIFDEWLSWCYPARGGGEGAWEERDGRSGRARLKRSRGVVGAHCSLDFCCEHC